MILRLYKPSAAAYTLADFYETRFRAELDRRRSKPSTVGGYTCTAQLWHDRHADLGLEAIEATHLAEFERHLRQQPGRLGQNLSPATVRKHLANLRAILRHAAPPDPTNPTGQSLRPPLYFRMPPPPEAAPTGWLDWPAIADAVIRSRSITRPAAALLAPAGRAAWLAALIYTATFTGLRPCALLRLRWSDLRPAIGGGLDVTIRPENNKRDRGQFHYIHPEAAARLATLRGQLRPAAPYVFADAWPVLASPNWRRFSHARKNVGEALKLTLGPDRTPGNVFRVFRKTHATELALISDTAAKISLGHRDVAILATHYANRHRLLREAIAALPSLDDEIRNREG